MKARVIVKLKDGVLDVQGKAVENQLREQGFKDVKRVRIGKVIDIELRDEKDRDKVISDVRRMCEMLLINPIMEEYEIVICQ